MAVTWGATFELVTPDSVARDVLVRPGAVTHTNNMGQRHVELSFEPGAGSLTVTAPPSPAVAPAGFHLLFVLDAGGVPSEGAWLRVGP